MEWSERNKLPFNINKCETTNVMKHVYKMNGTGRKGLNEGSRYYKLDGTDFKPQKLGN